MPGLRERKKQATRKAIISAAHELMAEYGFDNTSMESVAEQAEVSVGSLYNYFSDKRALLVGVFAESTFEVLNQGKRVLESEANEVRSPVRKLIHLYAKAFHRLDKGLLRQALGMSFTMEVEAAQDFSQFDRQMMEQLSVLITHLKKQKILNRSIGVEQATLALYGTFIVSVLIWVSTPEASLNDLIRTIDQQLEVVFCGLSPERNGGGQSTGAAKKKSKTIAIDSRRNTKKAKENQSARVQRGKEQ